MMFGTWPKEYALGEKLRIAHLRRCEYTDKDILIDLECYKNDDSRMRRDQRTAEIFLELLGQTQSVSGYVSLFGAIERTRDNIDRIHQITLAAASAPGAYDKKPDYNPHD